MADAARARYINDTFHQIPRDICHSIVPKETWSADAFARMRVYKIEPKDQASLGSYASYLTQCIEEATITPDAAYSALILAVHLHKPGKFGKDFRLLQFGTTPAPPKDQGDHTLPELGDFQEWNQAAAEQTQDEPGDDHESDDGDTITLDKGTPKTVGERTIRREQFVAFCCFFSAYLMRLCVKDIKDLVASYNTMKERFKRFMGVEVPSKYQEAPDKRVMDELKALFISDKTIEKTWVKRFVPAHDRAERNTPEDGLLTYLAVFPFQYSGMHALKLWDDIIIASGLDDNFLVHQLIHPRHNKALAALTEIYADHFPAASRKIGSYVKYARLVGPQYYPELQTKSCPGFVAVLAHLLKHYKASSAENSALSIFSIQGLSPEILDFSERAARLIVREAPKSAPHLYSSIMERATAGEGADDSDEEDGNTLTVGTALFKK